MGGPASNALMVSPYLTPNVRRFVVTVDDSNWPVMMETLKTVMAAALIVRLSPDGHAPAAVELPKTTV